jgi:uncharacterized protein YbaP (TraB family)
MNERIYGQRNRNWIPRIEGYLRSGQTYFVVGAGHMGGPDGLLSLLRTRGYKIEQFRFSSARRSRKINNPLWGGFPKFSLS